MNKHTAKIPLPVTYDVDPEDSTCFSIWYDEGGTGGEIAGRICDKGYAAYIVKAVNAHEALVEALRRISKVKPDRIDHVLDCVVLERAATIASETLKLTGEG
jgi:hypothetical protein